MTIVHVGLPLHDLRETAHRTVSRSVAVIDSAHAQSRLFVWSSAAGALATVLCAVGLVLIR